MHLAIVQCRNIQTLNFQLNDHPTIPSFRQFLKNMWASLGPNLRRLTINAAWKNFPLLVDSTLTTPVTSLDELSVRLYHSNATTKPKNPNPKVIRTAFVTFANSQRHSLQSLTISFFEYIDMSPIFKNLGHFPNLKELHLLVLMDRPHFSIASTLTHFLRAHKDTLEILVIPPSYNFDIAQETTFATWLKEFSTLELPSLQSLKIELWTTFQWTSVLPHVPRLTSLHILTARLKFKDVENMTKDLERSTAAAQLRHLHLSVAHFSWELLDLLSSKLPELNTLSVATGLPDTLSVVSLSVL